MRDATIQNMHEMNVRRDMLLLRQFEFLNTRVQAYEAVLSSRYSIFRSIFNPTWMKRAVDNYQLMLLQKAKKEMEAAQAKRIIKPVLVGRNG